MARPIKQGIDYFPFDVSFHNDKKIKMIKNEFGSKAEVLAVRLLCLIYADKGYYYQWGEDECLLICGDAGSDFRPNLVKEIVSGLVRRGFFDKNLFDSFGILTSKGIQKRYVEATKRRLEIFINLNYWLIEIPKNGVIVNKNEVNVCKNQVNDNIGTQSKVKESKVKKKKELYRSKFDQFWNAYDKKIGRKPTLQKWRSLSLEEINKILVFVPKYVRATPDPQYRKNPLTFLRQRGWEDEIIERSQNGSDKKESSKFIDELNEEERQYLLRNFNDKNN